jgi:hypothetical protein
MSRYYCDRTAIIVEQAEEPVHRRGVLRLLSSKALSHTVCTLAAPRRQAVRTDRISCKNCAKLSCAERRSLIDRNSRTHSCKPSDDSMGAVSATRSHPLCTGRTTRPLRFQSVRVHLRIHSVARAWTGVCMRTQFCVMGRTFASATEIPNNSFTATICGTNSCAMGSRIAVDRIRFRSPPPMQCTQRSPRACGGLTFIT